MEFLQVLFWAGLGSVFSLIGGLLLLRASASRKKIISYALPFGAGALLGAAFLSVLPEALHGGSEPLVVLAFALTGFLAFFVLERLLGWFHHHHYDHHHDAGEADKSHNLVHTYLVVIGDTLHNAIDGVAIGAAFLVNPAAGIATSIAVAAHEIPQEVGDFGILLGKGMRPKRVIFVNLFSALATLVAAGAVFLLGNTVEIDVAPLLALAAGFFIYIAASDIIPDIHERPRREGNRQAVMLLAGVAAIVIMSAALPHSHDSHESHESNDNHGAHELHEVTDHEHDHEQSQ